MGERVGRRLFPGARIVWLGAAVAIVLSLAFVVRILLAQTASLTGTNSVDVATVIATAGEGKKLCVEDLVIPPETARIQISMVALDDPAPALANATLTTPAGREKLRATVPSGGLTFPTFKLARPVDAEVRSARICLKSKRRLAYGGSFVQRLPRSALTSLDGDPVGQGDIGVRYLRKEGDSPRVVTAMATAIARANLFEPILGKVLMVLALPGLIGIVYLAVRIMALAEGIPLRRLALAAVAIAFVHAATWAVLLHPFHGADESEHYAYVEHLATTHERADSTVVSARSTYSSAQLRLMEALHHNSTILNTTSRLRWDEEWGRRYERMSPNQPRTDGGGGSESATGHSPLYYFVIGLPYRAVGQRLGIPDTLLMLRLINALFASMIAGIAVLTAGRLFGARHHAVAWAAGLLVGLQPVFGSVAGAVNNDTAVNLLAAVLLLGLVTAWQAGPTLRNAAILGVVAVLLPVSKITGFALLPIIGVAVVAIALRYGLMRTVKWIIILASSATVVAATWLFVASPLIIGERGALYNVHPAPTAATGQVVAAAPVSLEDRADYFAQTLLPDAVSGGGRWTLPGNSAVERSPLFYIYVNRGYGLFGWKSVELRPGLLKTIAVSLAVGWLLAAFALVRQRRRWRELGGVAILVTAILSVLAFISYAYANNAPHVDAGEQGRYLFTAIVPLGALFSGSLFAFVGRARVLATGLMAGAVPMLALICWLSALRGWFI